jgi:phosphoglycolate phosphatase
MGSNLMKVSKNWIFDFDGTLVDSAPAIKKCYGIVTNKVAPKRINMVKNLLIGPTLIETAKKILGPEAIDKMDDFILQFKHEYDQILLSETKSYDNADQVLKELKSRGDKIAIATNKRKEPTFKLIKHLGWNDYFNWVECVNLENELKKNKSDLVKSILLNEVDFQNAFFVGDTINDGLCSKENNLRFIKASYGYSERSGWEEIKIFKDIYGLTEILNI